MVSSSPKPGIDMKDGTKSISARILSVTRSTGSAIARGLPLPGLSEVKSAAKKLVDGLETLDDHAAKCQALTLRITSILRMLEPHCQDGEVSLELGYFYNKLEICQRQLARIDSRRGLSNALRAKRQVEIVEMVEQEIGTGLQDVLLSIMLKRLSAPRETATFQPVAKTTEEPSPSYTYQYPRIKRCQLNLETMVKRHRLDGVTRSIARGTYLNREVLVIQYSSRAAPGMAATTFLSSVKAIIQEQHPNVLRFIGASDDTSSFENHYMVFDAGTITSREAFLQSLRSAQKTFDFLEGVKAGMAFLLEYDVQTWEDIYVSQDGRAVVCLPYWDDPDTWSRSNHDVFTSLTGANHCQDFPLTTLSEILNMAGSRWSDFEQAVTLYGCGLRDYHLMQIAHELDLPVPPFLLVYCGPLPDFIVSVGSIGIPEWMITGQPSDCFSGLMTGWAGISSLWSCTGWEALQRFGLEYWTAGHTPCSDHECNKCSPGAAFGPLDSSIDGWLSYGCFESPDSFGVSYDLAISNPVLFEVSWKRFVDTRWMAVMDMIETEQSMHAIRHISVGINCKPPKMRSSLPLYFHRRPLSMFNVEHYWGFFSDSLDPNIPPCKVVRDIQVEYSIQINTTRVNDNWLFRAEQCFETVMSKTPGSFNAW
ncbi:putative RNA pseudouridylate synthase domain protein [Rhizoctonia solani 123E]|uniref:Putative RNA pseudouridylate synthase domain protein n=1 Tax=Rhizoctonia solani 123E TaxID=1423351 RepID=A0A074SEB6_9AGAM|nr:putative RNA pseudouridylate synthase domain protein [Rhizoctonia solani 123E]